MKYSYDERQRIYYHVDDRVFPDAILLDGGFKALAEGVGRNNSLKQLEFRYRGFGKEAVAVLRDALMVSKTITKVVIYENGNKEEVMTAVHKLAEDIQNQSPGLDIKWMI